MSEDKYSVIMTAFQGDIFGLVNALPGIFGRDGLGLAGVAWWYEELPSELIADIPCDEAVRIASALREFGAEAEAVPTSEVQNVLHRASELWADHVTERFWFSEIDGMILNSPPFDARRNLVVLRGPDGEREGWNYESAINHIHTGPDLLEISPREAIRRGNEIAAALCHDLRTLYPNITFVVSHSPGDVVTFYRATGDAPRETRPTDGRDPEKSWCTCCSKMQPYTKRTEPDAEFPEADWGDCAVCGNEVLVAAPEVLILVGPDEADTDH